MNQTKTHKSVKCKMFVSKLYFKNQLDAAYFYHCYLNSGAVTVGVSAA